MQGLAKITTYLATSEPWILLIFVLISLYLYIAHVVSSQYRKIQKQHHKYHSDNYPDNVQQCFRYLRHYLDESHKDYSRHVVHLVVQDIYTLRYLLILYIFVLKLRF